MKPYEEQKDNEKLWRRLQFLLKVAKLQWQEREYLNSVPQQYTFNIGLRTEDVSKAIKGLRHQMREVYQPKKQTALTWKTRDKIRTILGIYKSRRSRNEAFVSLGSKVDVRVDRHKASHDVFITVGIMWMKKVWEQFYEKGDYEQRLVYLILKAEEVRVNDRNLRLYEALVMNIESKETMSGWLCQAQMEKPKTVFATTANAAITRIQSHIHTYLDKTVKGASANE